MTRAMLSGILLFLVACPALAEELLPSPTCVRQIRAARIAEMQERPDLQLENLKRAHESCPESASILATLLEYHRKNESAPEEVERFRKLLIQRIGNPQAPLPPGALRYLAENPETAQAELEELLRVTRLRLESTPEDVHLLKVTAHLQERLEKVEDALVTYRKLMEVKPSGLVRRRLMDYALLNEQWEEALSLLEPVVKNQEKLAIGTMSAYLMLLAKTGKVVEFAEWLERFDGSLPDSKERLHPMLTSFLLQTAWDLYDLGHVEASQGVFRKMLARAPEDPVSQKAMVFLFGTADDRRAQQQAMAEKLNQVEDPEALLQEGVQQLAGNNFQQAYDLLTRAAAALPQHELAQLNLGLAAIRIERWSEAEAALARAVAINPSRAQAHFNLGISLSYLERYDEAIKTLEHGLSLDPSFANAHYYLWLCHRNAGRPDEAKKHLAIYNEATPR
ncbi:hypothetical protein ABI59_08950 [Acidobacteria bacterium Mor1]|nr:hypothetical protein ABI59_08950 [Acidobacteria bacterium Mor1]